MTQNYQLINDTPSELKEFERMALQACIFNSSIAQKAVALIEPEYFEDIYYQNIFKEIKKFWGEGKSIKNPNIIKTVLKNDPDFKKTQGDKIDQFSLHIDDLFKYEVLSKDEDNWVIENMEKWIKNVKILDLTYKLHDAQQAQENPYSKTPSTGQLIEDMANAFKISLRPQEYYDIDDKELLYSVVDDMANGLDLVESNMDIINKVFGENLVRGGVGILAGLSGAGKSIHLQSHFLGAIERGYNALYVTYELSVNLILQRIISDRYDVHKGSMRSKAQQNSQMFKSEIDRKYKVLNGKRGHGMIATFPSMECGVDEVDAYVRDVEKNKGIKFDLVVFDYLGNMGVSQRFKKQGSREESEWRNLITIVKEIENFSKEHNLFSWTAMQLRPESEEKDYLTKVDIGASKGVINAASIAYAFKDGDTPNTQKCFTLKTRNTELIPVFLVGKFFEHQRIGDIDQSLLNLSKSDNDIVNDIRESKQTDEELSIKSLTRTRDRKRFEKPASFSINI